MFNIVFRLARSFATSYFKNARARVKTAMCVLFRRAYRMSATAPSVFHQTSSMKYGKERETERGLITSALRVSLAHVLLNEPAFPVVQQISN